MSKSFEDVGFDQSATAEVFLDKILDDSSEETIQKKLNEAGVEEELKRERLIEEASSRMRSRVLFVTQKTDVFEKDSLAQRNYTNLQMVFDEVHVLVLTNEDIKKESIRVAPKVWAYSASLKSTFFIARPALAVAAKHLSFADGFRPDIVIALDPFESGVVGLKLAQKYQRVFQVHIFEDFMTPTFLEEKKENKKRLGFAKKTLQATQSVRVESEHIKQKLETAFPNIKDVSLLPRFFNIKEITEAVATVEKKRLFPQYSFVILYVGTLDSESMLFRSMDAARKLLSTPSVGLVVVGDGPRKNEFLERAKILKIDSQIVFKKDAGDAIEYMQAADVMLLPDTSKDSEDTVIRAAAAGLPMVLARTALRDDLFVDGQDAFLCDPDDTFDFYQKLTKFINTNALRVQFAENARDVVLTRIQESPEMYQIAYRDSIEMVLYLEEAAQVEKERLQQELEEKESSSERMSLTESIPVAENNESGESEEGKRVVGGVEMKMPEN